ncbi:Aste57867_850 [Aphanomyces stellatus]|uniref:Aste57867_850 protein n=1 Tax=Aphanomyces stellatus TaxID=120398 RepID=A0A485K6C3_9STRA|nr:hypothetical protein As57867_000849 [Aphanomyces stellatus]VFT78074.1 Aste57867_850 [Aphanomyces stellatus]
MLPAEPFASSRVHFLHYIDVLVCATDESAKGYRKHTNYMLQINEIGKGHWVVPRRYTQFRLLWRSVLKLYQASTVKETRANAKHLARFKTLSGFAFPKKTLKVLFVGLDSTSETVVADRLFRFDAFLQELILFMREFQWDEAHRAQNAITTKDANTLCWLLHTFLGVPKGFRSGSACDYLHHHPLCQDGQCHDLRLMKSRRRHSTPPPKVASPPPPPLVPSSTTTTSKEKPPTDVVPTIALDESEHRFPIRVSPTVIHIVRKQQSKSDPAAARPSVWMDSMRGSDCAFDTPFHFDYSMPILGDSPRDTIVLGA